MADNQRVHPTTEDVEKNAGEYADEQLSAPLVPKSSLESEKGGVYTSPSGWQNRVQFPRDQVIQTRQIRRPYSRPPKRQKSCCRRLCCTICFLFALVAVIAIISGILYLVVRPRIPKYSVESIKITNISINGDLSTNCQFVVNISARNPNSKMELCTGALPVFYQGYKNTTFLDVAVSGTGAKFTIAMVSTLKEQQQQARVPLKFDVDED